jgi:hypothetical protein
MMARSKCSNQRPDTLMQDRSPPARRNLLQRTAGPYIGVKSAGLTPHRPLPVYPNQRRLSDRPSCSVWCHSRWRKRRDETGAARGELFCIDVSPPTSLDWRRSADRQPEVSVGRQTSASNGSDGAAKPEITACQKRRSLNCKFRGLFRLALPSATNSDDSFETTPGGFSFDMVGGTSPHVILIEQNLIHRIAPHGAH